MKKFFITGSNGQLGRELSKQLDELGIQNVGYDIPELDISDYESSLELVKKASTVEKHVRYVGWDVCFSKKGPLIVEGNEFPGHDIYQLPEHTPNKIGIWPKFTKAFKDK